MIKSYNIFITNFKCKPSYKITSVEAPKADQVEWEACHLFFRVCKYTLQTLKDSHS